MNGRAPAPVDETGALDFGDKKAKPAIAAVIHVAYQGVPIDINVTAARDQIEKTVQNLLGNGWTAPPQPARGGFGGRPDTRVEADKDATGNEICPVHKTKIRTYKTKDGREFKGCPSKATGAQGEKINQNGFCDLRFK